MGIPFFEKSRPEKLRQHLETVAVPRDIFANPETLGRIEGYITDRFEEYGYKVRREPFPLEGLTLNNLIAARPDLPPDAPFLLIGAHFDGVPGTPGADDNASGVAALLEAARLVSQMGPSPAVVFAAFNAEEYGMVGSSCYAQTLKEQKVPLAGMISLEMVGYTDKTPGSQKIPAALKPFYPSTGDFLALVGDFGSSRLLKQAKAAFSAVENLEVHTLSLPMQGRVFPECRLSDHSPFWDLGYPALMVTDTSFFRNPHYHLGSDTVETLDMEFLARVTEGTARLAVAFLRRQ